MKKNFRYYNTVIRRKESNISSFHVVDLLPLQILIMGYFQASFNQVLKKGKIRQMEESLRMLLIRFSTFLLYYNSNSVIRLGQVAHLIHHYAPATAS